jgi:hypothetical protein
VRAVLAGDARVGQRGQEAGRAVEVGHLQVGGAHARGVVRVRACPAGQGIGRGQGESPLVRCLFCDLGVEDLDDVYGARRAQAGEHPAQARAERVERVRRVDQAALGPDPGDDLGRRQHVRDPLGQEQADHVAVRGPDLLADDDADAQVAFCGGHGGRGHVVVGDAHHVEPGLAGAVGQLVEGEYGVAGRDRVQVAVDPDHQATRTRLIAG